MYGSKIQSIRLARGYTQEYMASQLGIAQNTYSRIEKDERAGIDDELLKKIAGTLGVSVEDIKSPMPIVMNFDNSQYNVPFGTQHNHINEKILESLNSELQRKDAQLKAKDEQIAYLLRILEQGK